MNARASTATAHPTGMHVWDNQAQGVIAAVVDTAAAMGGEQVTPLAKPGSESALGSTAMVPITGTPAWASQAHGALVDNQRNPSAISCDYLGLERAAESRNDGADALEESAQTGRGFISIRCEPKVCSQPSR